MKTANLDLVTVMGALWKVRNREWILKGVKKRVKRND